MKITESQLSGFQDPAEDIDEVGLIKGAFAGRKF